MIFNSFEFLIFFVLFLCGFFALPRPARGPFLLVASYVFYGVWRPAYCLLLAFTTVVDYTTARIIDGTSQPLTRKLALASALTINLGILATLKYLDFFLTTVSGAAGLLGYAAQPGLMHLLLPVGISFYTFQSIGYTIDVYRRRIPAEHSLLVYAQYVSFFPQLVAGPIERGAHMLPQFRQQHRLLAENFAVGLWFIGWGLFKKMCVADVVAPFVDRVFAQPRGFDGSYTFLATVLFAIQVYADFSGYSTIARGVARMFDYDLMVNFRQPYFSTSITEFWRRWHISLTAWFRDYLYIALGGNRVSAAKQVRNVLVVFALCGLWHGAAWTYVVWGLLHGVAQLMERLVWRFGGNITERFPPWSTALLGWLWMATVVLAGLVFFRSHTFGGALVMFHSLGHPGHLQYGVFKVTGFAAFSIFTVLLTIPTLFLLDAVIYYRPQWLQGARARPMVGALGAVVLFYTIVFFGVFGHADFIYFQF